jgi:hypothetical protein
VLAGRSADVSEPVAPSGLLRLLLDLDRLAVAGALAARPLTTDELIVAAGRRRREVLMAIADLRAAGLVVVEDERYRIDTEALRAAAQAAADFEVPMDPIVGFGMTYDERDVLARMFSGRTLNEIPSNRAKRQILLQRLALEFQVGRHYTEREVNELLFVFHPDWSALRRYLVDEGFLDRSPGTDPEGRSTNLYWRSGGRVTDLPSG